MDALRDAIAKIQSDPGNATSSTLCELITCLDAGEQFRLSKLYQLNYSDFSLAMEILKQWRLDSYRYEPGLLARAAADPSMDIDVTALRYGRWGEATIPVIGELQSGRRAVTENDASNHHWSVDRS